MHYFYVIYYVKLQLIVDRLVIVVRIRRGRRATVQLRRDGVGNVLDFLEFLLKVISGNRLTLRVNPLNGLRDSVQNRLLVIGIQFATETVRITELGLEAVDVGREGVESFNALLLSFVLSGELLSFGNHTVNLFLSETPPLVDDSDRLRFAGTLVGGGNLHDTVGVDFECDLDLGNTAGSRRNIIELKLAENVVVLGEGAFALKDLDQDGRLVVGGGGEDLAFASGNNSATRDELGHDTTSSLNTERERVDIDKDNITQALIASEDTTLNSGTVGDCLIMVDTLGRLLPEVLFEELLDLGDTSGTTDENDLQGVSAGLND
jgi:hypothetical protein